jgi:hypothetical protein
MRSNPLRRICSLLYVPTIALLLMPAGSLAQKDKTDPDMIEMQNYTLSVDKVDRFGDAMHDLAQLAQKNPNAASAMETDADKNEDLDATGRRFSSNPEIVGVLKSHGFSPREFALCEMVIFQSAFAEAAKQAGADPAKLASDAHVNPANLTFVEQHKTELDAMRKKYSGAGGNDE